MSRSSSWRRTVHSVHVVEPRSYHPSLESDTFIHPPRHKPPTSCVPITCRGTLAGLEPSSNGLADVQPNSARFLAWGSSHLSKRLRQHLLLGITPSPWTSWRFLLLPLSTVVRGSLSILSRNKAWEIEWLTKRAGLCAVSRLLQVVKCLPFPKFPQDFLRRSRSDFTFLRACFLCFARSLTS
jgi:hypothetical protein